MGSRNARRPALGFTLRCSKYTFEHSKMNYRILNAFILISNLIQKNDFYIGSTQIKQEIT